MADVVTVYPANGAVGVYLSENIFVEFDELMDVASINRGTFVVTGPEHTLFSGPDTLRWLDLLEDEELFDSPGFDGFMQGSISFETIGNGGSDPYRTKAIFKPSVNLSPNTQFKVYLFGDQGSHLGQNVIQSISVGNVVPIVHTGTGELTVSGSYHGNDDAINVQVTSGGERGDAFIRWWFDSSPASVTEKLVRRSVQITDELALNFASGTYEKDDRWQIPLYKATQMESVYQWSFTTGSQKMAIPPTDTSEEVTAASCPSSTFSADPFVDALGTFPNASYGISVDIPYIDIYIDKVLDVSTIDEDTVRMLYQRVDFPFAEGTVPIVVEADISEQRTHVRIKF